MRAINLAKASCGYMRSEDVKVYLLGHHLSGTAERSFHKKVDRWWNQRATLDYVICQLLATFKTRSCLLSPYTERPNELG